GESFEVPDPDPLLDALGAEVARVNPLGPLSELLSCLDERGRAQLSGQARLYLELAAMTHGLRQLIASLLPKPSADDPIIIEAPAPEAMLSASLDALSDAEIDEAIDAAIDASIDEVFGSDALDEASEPV